MGGSLSYNYDGRSFVIEDAALPFLFSKDLIWATMPGEDKAVWPSFTPYGQANASGFEPLGSDDFRPSVCGGFGEAACNPATLSNRAFDYVDRAIANGKRFFRGEGVWGQTESYVLGAMHGVILEWIQILRGIEHLIEWKMTNAVVPPSDLTRPLLPLLAGPLAQEQLTLMKGPGWKIKWPAETLFPVRSLRIELQWANQTFDTFQHLIDRVRRGEALSVQDEELDTAANLAVGYLRVSDFGRGHMYYEKAKGLVDEAETFLGDAHRVVGEAVGSEAVAQVRSIIRSAHRTVWTVRQAAQELYDRAEASVEAFNALKDQLAKLGTTIADLRSVIGTVGSVISTVQPYFVLVGFVFSAIAEIVGSLTHKEEGIDGFMRGDKHFYRRHVEAYITMSYRAVLQSLHRVRMLGLGVHPAQLAAKVPEAGTVISGAIRVLPPPPPPPPMMSQVMLANPPPMGEEQVEAEEEEEVLKLSPYTGEVFDKEAVPPAEGAPATMILLGLGTAALIGYFALKR